MNETSVNQSRDKLCHLDLCYHRFFNTFQCINFFFGLSPIVQAYFKLLFFIEYCTLTNPSSPILRLVRGLIVCVTVAVTRALHMIFIHISCFPKKGNLVCRIRNQTNQPAIMLTMFLCGICQISLRNE